MKRPSRSAPTSRPKRRASSIAIKRAYDKPSPQDGLRILIDRLWPRGLSKATLKIDAWPRELAPSTDLRKWYGHEPARFAEFRRRYRAELAAHAKELGALRAMVRRMDKHVEDHRSAIGIGASLPGRDVPRAFELLGRDSGQHADHVVEGLRKQRDGRGFGLFQQSICFVCDCDRHIG